MPSILNFEIKEKKQEQIYEEEQVADIPIPEVTAEDFTDDEEAVDLKQEIIEFVKKPDIVAEEIFSNAPVKKRGKPTRSTSPKKTKRKPMSEEDKAKRREALARGRETRMRNLAKKKQEQQTQKELSLNKQPVMVCPPVAGGHTSDPEPAPAPAPAPAPVQMRQSITAEDIERSQMNTLLAYEKMRKQRKEEKKKVKQIEEQQKQIKQTIQQVSAPSWGTQRHRGKYGGMLQSMGL